MSLEWDFITEKHGLCLSCQEKGTLLVNKDVGFPFCKNLCEHR